MDHASVQAVFEAISREIELYPRRKKGVSEYFEDLVAAAREALPAPLAPGGEDELRVVTAMSWLGPRGPAPPCGLRDHLLNAVLRPTIPDPAQRLKRALEFTLAYGCGRWASPSDPGAWSTMPWPNAVTVLRQEIQGWVREVLDRIVLQTTVGPADARGDAHLLASLLLHPLKTVEHDPGHPPRIDRAAAVTEIRVSRGHLTHLGDEAKYVFRVLGPAVVTSFKKPETPRLQGKAVVGRRDWADGTRAVVTSRPSATWLEVPAVRRLELEPWQWAIVEAPHDLEVFECACGTQGCPRKHRLGAWDPADARTITLWSFLASAVKGPQSDARYGSIVAGMYYPLLVQGTPSLPPMRGVRVEFKGCACLARFQGDTCIKCGAGKVCACLARFQGDTCVKCGAGFDPATMLRNARDWIVPADSPAYEEQPRLRCVNKEEHYRRLTGREPDRKLPETWENFYDVPAEFAALREAREAGDADRVKELRRIVFEETRCPICAGRPNSPESHLWVWTGRQVVGLAGEEDCDD
jgi:hypothetical protein